MQFSSEMYKEFFIPVSIFYSFHVTSNRFSLVTQTTDSKKTRNPYVTAGTKRKVGHKVENIEHTPKFGHIFLSI